MDAGMKGQRVGWMRGQAGREGEMDAGVGRRDGQKNAEREEQREACRGVGMQGQWDTGTAGWGDMRTVGQGGRVDCPSPHPNL